jgi:hypothetical protein
MLEHQVDQFIVRPFGVIKAELVIGRALAAQRPADSEAGG